MLGQTRLDDAAVGGGENSQGMGAEVVPVRLAEIWERKLKRLW